MPFTMSSELSPWQWLWKWALDTHLEELLVALVTVDNVTVDEYFIQEISHRFVADSALPKGKEGGWTVTKAPHSDSRMEEAEKESLHLFIKG